MALVTVQRSPSVAGSPQCSISDGDAEEDEIEKCEKSCSSECFFAGKGTALVLALKDIPQYAGERRLSTDSTRSTNSTQSNNSDIQLHLQSMFYLLRHDETLKMAVKLESQRPNRTRYLAIATRSNIRNLMEKKAVAQRSSSKTSLHIKTKYNNSEKQDSLLTTEKVSNYKCSFQDNKIQNKEQSSISGSEIDEKSNRRKADRQEKVNTANDIEESCLLGIDCNEKTTIGLVVPILADTTIHLDGDGGFSVSVYGKTHIFKPVSVQAMWSALQTLHKVSQKARESNFYPGGPSHEWIAYYEKRIESDQSCLNEWNAMDALESRRPPSPDAIRNKPTEREETERIIRMKLKEIMMSVDLDEVTSKYIRSRLEDLLDMDLGEYKSFIDEEMLTILGQMDAPTEIFEHVYLGSEWNASNLEELQRNGVRHILNVTREIDNFFPGMFDYFNVRVYDDEKTNLLKYWDNTYKYISSAKTTGSKVLVHCKMGVSRSASVVIAYAMKAYNWDFEQALQHVKDRRSCIKPNKNFLSQLETYRGMLDAMKNKEKLQRSKSETNLKSTKDARLLPGSEPTPLIQAWNQSKKSTAEKQRKLLRRSSSTSPKSIQSSIVIKQQSQSLENLTPDRTTVDMMQKNVRFPASNGQNYSVTQNQILHIQKNSPTTLVKTIVSGLESNDRKTSDDRKSLILQIDRSTSVDGSSSRASESDDQTHTGGGSNKTLGSPVWTSSAKLIQQTSNILSMQDDAASSSTVVHRIKEPTINSSADGDIFSSQLDNVFDKLESRQSTRKTQSWTAASNHGEVFASRQSSSSSIDSAVVLAYQGERRELPSRHSSWGSGDNRVLPSRNSSWGSYDTNRHKIYNTAIFEGQIQNCHHDFNVKETNTIPRIGPSDKNDPIYNPGTVKRTKQKLEESTVLKKRCQNDFKPFATTKRSSNLCRSESAVSTRQRHPSRCNSEEIILSTVGLSNTQELSVSAPDSYPISQMGEQTDKILTQQNKDEEKISGNVQSLKKSFEAKANKSEKKGKSLPSSPVAVHASESSSNATAAVSSQNKTNRTDNIATEPKDRNVKGLVNKYQSTGHRSNSNSASSSLKMRPSSFYESRTSNNISLLRTPDYSYNSSNISKVRQDFNSRPPPVPTSVVKPLHHPSNNSITMTEGILSQNLSCNYRRMQQHGKTHPLARLSLTKPRLNTAAAYNTM